MAAIRRDRRPSAPLRRYLAVALLTHAVPLSLHAQGLSLGEVMRDTVLANGLHVIVVPNPTIPLATIQVTVRNGAFTQRTAAEEGLPHILEHMLFRSFASGAGFSDAANRIDAHYNGTTSSETVTYYITLPSANLDRGVRLMADLMRQPRFRDEDLKTEKDVVGGELQRAASSPSYLHGAMVDRLLWGDAWTQKNAIGNLVTIHGATPARLKEVYERFYVPNNSALVITGDITAAEGFSSAARHFERWRRGADPFADFTPASVPELKSNRQTVVDIETNDVSILVRWHGPGVRADRNATYAADVFAALVNSPVSGLQSRLVDSGLFQSVGMGYATLNHTGPITLRALTTADQLADASAALRAEIDRMSEPGYITAAELDIAKKGLAVDWAMYMETPTGLASVVGELWSVAGLDYTRGYLTAMQAQGIDDIERFVATYLGDRPRVMGVMMSPSTRRGLGSSLQTTLGHWRD
jgi:zinc protease